MSKTKEGDATIVSIAVLVIIIIFGIYIIRNGLMSNQDECREDDRSTRWDKDRQVCQIFSADDGWIDEGAEGYIYYPETSEKEQGE